jgi:hypothetical protein
MSITHVFYNNDFGNGFSTRNAILNNTPYKPEVLFVGTFNPNTPNTNFADFFYGRNFFWPAFKNLFIPSDIFLDSRRIPNRGRLPEVLNPSLIEIQNICNILKFSFCDLISQVLHNGDPSYEILYNDNILFQNREYNLIQDTTKNGILGLNSFENYNQIDWNTNLIINYLIQNPSIHTVYLTRRPIGIYGREWNRIVSHPDLINRTFTNIFSPSAQGSPVYYSMSRLIEHWLHNTNPNFGRLNELWFINNNARILF